MLQRAAKNAYSWWWASHIRTKQSKWLEENLEDMEEKVEYILKIIQEDGDSFAQRAEMYYRKRPELVNFVEDSFRGYRALAERYDHLSKELQNANRTIASVYPERVHLHLDDEDGENFTPSEISPDEFTKLSNTFPVAPKLSIPKVPNLQRSNAKVPTRLMSKKGLLKINAIDASPTTPRSGLSKSEALQEIDRLQKGILVYQTEKEFVKSAYETGLAKYWEIENQVTEMQVKVSSLQDEFGIGTYIEDDEARKLMTGTALKSCQDTLARLQEKQKESAEEARLEYEKIQGVQDKFKILKQEFISNHPRQQDMVEEQRPVSLKLDSEKLEEENLDLESLRAKIKEEFGVSSGNSVTMSELAEKADELVDKVINLEFEITSQNAYVKRLRSETNELQAHLQSLEEEKESLIENSDIKNKKIRELEEELRRAQSLKLSIRDQNNNLQTHFTEASCNLDNLSEKFLNIKPDEEVENTSSFSEMKDVAAIKPVKQFQEAADIVRDTSKDVKASETMEKAILAERIISTSIEDQTNLVQTRWSNQLADSSQNLQETAVPGATSEAGMSKEEMRVAPSSKLGGTEDMKVSNEVKKGSTAEHSNINGSHNLQLDQRKHQVGYQVNAAPGDNLRNLSKETEDSVSTGNNVTKSTMENEAKKHEVRDNSTFVRAEEDSLLLSNVISNKFDFLESQERATLDTTPIHELNEGKVMTMGNNDSRIMRSVRMNELKNGDEILIHNAFPRYEEASIGSVNQGSPFYDPLGNGQFGALVHESSEKGSKELGEMIDPPHYPYEGTKPEIKRKLFDDISNERQDTASKRSEIHEDLTTVGHEPIISTPMKVNDDKKGDAAPAPSTFEWAEENHSRFKENRSSDDLSRMAFFKDDLKIQKENHNLPGNIQEEMEANDPRKRSEQDASATAIHDISTISRDAASKHETRKDQNNFQESELYSHLDKFSGNNQAAAMEKGSDSIHSNSNIPRDMTRKHSKTRASGSGEGSKAHEGTTALHDITSISRGTATEEESMRDLGAMGKPGQSDMYSQLLEPSGYIRVKNIAENGSEKGVEDHTDLMATRDISAVLRNTVICNSEQPNLQNQFDIVSRNAQEKGVSAIGLGKGSESHEGIPSHGDISYFSRDMNTEEELRSNNSQQSDLHDQFHDVSRNVQVKDVASTGSGNQSDAREGITASHEVSSISNDMAREEEIRRDSKATGSSGQSDVYDLLNDVSGYVRATKGTAAADGGKKSEAHRDMPIEKEWRDGKATANSGQSDLYNQLNDASGDSVAREEGKEAEVHESTMAPRNISNLSSNTATEKLRREGEINGNMGQSVSYNPFGDFLGNAREEDVAATHRGKGSGAHEGIMTLDNTSTLSIDAATEDPRREGKSFNPFDDVSGIVPERGEIEGFGAHEGILALHNSTTFSQDTATEEQLRREGKISENSRQSEWYSTFDDVARNIQENDVAGTATISRSTEGDENQGKFHEPKKQDLFQTVYGDPYLKQSEFAVEEDGQPNWKELFLNGLDDREKILLQEYTSILRNFKEVKKKLNDVEKTKRASLFQYAIQLKLLRSANAVKDSEIQSLQKKLNGPQDSQESLHVSGVRSLKSDQKEITNSSEKITFNSREMMEESTAPEQAKISNAEEDDGDIEIISVDESHNFSTIEDKIRMDIDELLEENIEFWLRFSTSFHQIQKFQSAIQDLQAELVKLKENKKQDGNTKNSSILSEIRPIYRHLREIQTELTLWLEHNTVLKDDLQNRLSSLSSLHEELTRLPNTGSKMEENELSDYQAAKFQGEILNMKQENNKVADELQAGVKRVRNLQVEIQRTLENLDEELGISSKNQQSKNRSRIPLRSFLFGVKLKKQRPSIFACVTPTLQKQYSDITTVPI